ncbi:Uncharacterized protein involved in cytokinesis%2C contains TGc (transglutaminase/protease-like) domain [uncultured Eubacterium sp.]|nr:Uncharacterized protein involved in cytokinesis%2C contains TGc (transglutaminase/protease-like) domain [uncultured Eubacterium sp.]
MSKVKKRMRIAATIMAVSLSATMITTNMIPVAEVPVQAVEDENTYSKVADSKIEGFYYEKNGYGNVQCTIDKTLEYSSYDEMISKLSEITKKIIQENAYANYSFDFSIRISSDQKDTRLETQKADKDLEKEIYKETGDPKGGHTMAAMGGGLTHLKVTYSEADKAYIGKVYGSAGYGSKTDRYNQTIQKLDEVIKSLDLDGKSDYDKFKAITYWIVSNVKYDNYYAVKDNSSMTPGTKYPHDMTGAVLDGYAVCDGYAGTFYYMANAVGLNALFDGGITKSNRVRHAWNLVQIDGTYYYTDPTNAYFKEDGEPGKELLPGQKYLFILYTLDDTTIEDTYSNISKDDYLKEHSVCKGNHNFYEAGGKIAQCETPGTTRYRCSNSGCLYKYEIEAEPAFGHAWDGGKVTQEQSCDKPEITTYTCTRSGCKKTKQEVTKESLGGHTWNNGEVTTKPTCTEEGVKTYTCTRCGETKTESIAKVAHVDEEHVVTPATCTSQGVSYYVCKNCGRTTQRRPTAKKAHTPELRKQKEATCKSEGYTGDTYCSVCGKLLESGQKIAKKEHTPGEWEITQPTCKKYGLKRRDCTVCGESLDLEVLEKLDHAWDRGVITKEATETEEGVKTYTCKTCGETKTESIPVISHHWDQGTVSKEATCTEDGEKTYHCTDEGCNKTWVETIPATGHQHTEVCNKKEATCEEDGYSGDTYCKDCGQLISKGTVIKTTGHSWDDGKVSEEATCKKAGIKTYTCKNCGETKTVAIPKKEHSFDEGKIQKKATCTEEGYTGDTYCTDCGELVKKGSVTEKADHNWKVVSEEKATCEKNGSKTYTCEDCEETKTETIPATGHKFSFWKTVKAQSIYSGAVQERICSACGKKETRIVGDKLKPVLKVNAPKLQLKRGQKTQKFTLTDMAKGDSVKSWVSSNKKIVTVSGKPNGTCIIKAGKKTGSAKITITMKSNLKKTIGVKVQKKAVACTSIKNVPKKLTLNKKKSYQLKPVIEPITCTQKIKYKTSNKKIAKINSKGKITAVKKGTAKITISVGKKKTVCKITIK